jgi:hypothetical protein
MSVDSRKAHVRFEVFKSKVELEVIKRLGPGPMTENLRQAWRIVKDHEAQVRDSWSAKRSPRTVAEEIAPRSAFGNPALEAYRAKKSSSLTRRTKSRRHAPKRKRGARRRKLLSRLRRARLRKRRRRP